MLLLIGVVVFKARPTLIDPSASASGGHAARLFVLADMNFDAISREVEALGHQAQ
jgi:hypothetical protein